MNKRVQRLRTQGGMGLVELMVGVVIGMIGVLVIFQTMSTWGGRTATTMSGGDAQTSGALGVFYLERDIKQAGWGFGTAASAEGGPNMGCTVSGQGYILSPVVITQTAVDEPDQITVLYGTSPIFTAAGKFSNGTSTLIKTDSWGGFKTGDRVILGSGGQCRLATIGTPPSRNLPLAYASGSGSVLASGIVFNMGAAIVRARWEVNGGLRWGDNAATETISPVADGVVDLQAEYGFGNLLTGGVTWQDPSVAVADWTQLKAVRFAILVRSKNYEKPGADGCPATRVRPTWFGQNFIMRDLDGNVNDTDVAVPAGCTGTININDWHHYRYEVFERVVPLRNVMWGGIGE